MSSWDTQCRRTCHETREKINESGESGEGGKGGEGWGGKVQTATGRKEGGKEGGMEGGRCTTLQHSTPLSLLPQEILWLWSRSSGTSLLQTSANVLQSQQDHKDIIKCAYLLLFCCSVVTKQGTEPLLEETSHMTFWQDHMTLGLGHVTSHDPLDSLMPQWVLQVCSHLRMSFAESYALETGEKNKPICEWLHKDKISNHAFKLTASKHRFTLYVWWKFCMCHTFFQGDDELVACLRAWQDTNKLIVGPLEG